MFCLYISFNELQHGLRTEFKRIWPYDHWASAFAFKL